MTDSPATRPPLHDLAIDQKLALKTAATRLEAESADTFGAETIERFLRSSYDQFAGRSHPAGQGVDAIRPIRDDIEERVHRLLADLNVPETR